MTPPPGYIRCNRKIACPVCSRFADGCMVSRDGTKAWCVRVVSNRPRENGWVHDLANKIENPMLIEPVKKTIGIDIAGIATRFEQALYPECRASHAQELGVSAESLYQLRMGWSKGDEAFSFPMRAASGDTVGIRLRNHAGEKWSIRGGHEGLFYSPLRLTGDTLYITEGPTDTAVLLDLGLPAIGRPSCTGGTEHLLRLIRAHHHIVIVADHDGPGVAGAESLADRIVGIVRSVKVIEPLRGKDIREWRTKYGLSGASLRRVVLNSTPWQRRTPGSSCPGTSTSVTRSAGPTASNGSARRPA